MEKLLERIKKNPEEAEKVLELLASLGLLKGKTLKVKRISNEMLKNLDDSNVIIIKG